MNVWHLLLVFEMALCAVVVIFLFLSWYRKSRAVSKAHSSGHRLKIPNLWTDVRRVHHHASQMMRMKDGNFVMVDVSAHSLQVLVGSQPGPPETMTLLMSLSTGHSGKSRRQYQAEVLEELRNQIGLPESTEELCRISQALRAPEQMAKP